MSIWNAHKHAKGHTLLHIDHTLILHRPCPMMSLSFHLKEEEKETKIFYSIWNRLCLCVRVRACLNIFPTIKQTPASNVFLSFFLFAMLAINWAHPYNHRDVERLFNLFFVLLFDLSCVRVRCCWCHLISHLPSPFFFGTAMKVRQKQKRR